MVAAVVHDVDAKQRVLWRNVVVNARRAKVFANPLQRMAEGFGNAAAQFRTVGHRPESQQGSGAGIDTDVGQRSTRIGYEALAGAAVGHQRHIAESQVLPVAFVVAEKKQLVFLDWAAQRPAKLIALKRWNGALSKEIAGVKGAVPQKLIGAAMHS